MGQDASVGYSKKPSPSKLERGLVGRAEDWRASRLARDRKNIAMCRSAQSGMDLQQSTEFQK